MNDTLEEIHYIVKLYDTMCQTVCKKNGITRTELDVLAFLKNHPTKDNAKDIVEIRMLPKANVSQAVEALIQKEYLMRTPDEKDRRKIHLSITPKAKSLVRVIKKMQTTCYASLFEGFSAEEMEQYQGMIFRMHENAKKGIEANH